MAPVTKSKQLAEQTAKIADLQAGFKTARDWSVEAQTVIKTCEAKIAAAEARVAAGAGSNGSLTIVMRTVGPPIRPYAVLITSASDARAVRQAVVDWIGLGDRDGLVGA
eukprot:gene9516-biopygen7039